MKSKSVAQEVRAEIPGVGEDVCGEHSAAAGRRPASGADEGLRSSEERFHVMAEGMPHTVWESDPLGRTLYTNSRWSAYVGEAAAAAQGMDWLRFYHPDDRDHLLAEWEQSVATRGAHPYDVEVRIRRHDGVYRWFRATGAPIMGPAGAVVKWVGACIDIDERKQAEIALRQLQSSTARSLALLDTLQIHAPIGIGFVDRDFRYVRVNDRLAAINGVPAAAHIGCRVSDTVPALWPQIAPIYRRVLAGESVLDVEVSGSTASCPGDTRHWLASYYPVRENGEISGIGLIVQDITERRRSEQRERVRNTVLAMIVAGTPQPEILDAVVRGAEEQLPGVLCSILLLDVFGSRLVHGAAPSLPDFYTAAIDGVEIGPAVGSCGAAAYRGERVVVADIASHPYWQDYKGLAAAADLASCWSEPICASSGKVLGTFAIYHRQPVEPGERELELLANAANLASIAIEHRQNDEALNMAASVYQAIGEAIMVTDAQNRIAAVNPAFTRLTGYLPADVVGKNPKLLSSGRQDKAFYQRMWQALESTGRWQGEVWNRSKDGREFAEWLMINGIYDSGGHLQRWIALFSDITDQKKSEETIWRQANYDPLTLLPNRRLFHDRLALEMKRTARAGKSLALMLIDLDHFKEVNDSLGHDAGDTLLIEAAHRIQDCVRDSDTVARLGGDEFTIILSGLDASSRIDDVAQAVVDRLSQPFRIREELAYVSASVGISLFPSDAEAITDLVKNADQAMYAAKHAGRKRFCYFIPSMQSAALSRLQLMRDLRGALAGGQFEVHFQPIVELASGRILKAEALLRWFHPERGLIGPADFIPLAEDAGLINDIGDWVFRESACQVQRWQMRSHQRLQVSVNISPLQILSCDACAQWGEYLRELGLFGENIALEVTERLLLSDHPDVLARLARYRAAGVSVVIDDFGTGYSALSYLKKFKVDYLKIDRSFISDLATDASDRTLVEAIIVMAHKLGIRVIAEGVETNEQRRFLIAAGCDYGQGYLFARPVPAAEFETLLAAESPYFGAG